LSRGRGRGQTRGHHAEQAQPTQGESPALNARSGAGRCLIAGETVHSPGPGKGCSPTPSTPICREGRTADGRRTARTTSVHCFDRAWQLSTGLGFRKPLGQGHPLDCTPSINRPRCLAEGARLAAEGGRSIELGDTGLGGFEPGRGTASHRERLRAMRP
jgi:hypothetical protein